MPAPIPATITYPAELPVSGRRDDIARAVRDHQVVIVAGATGSGKTTQLPKICLELGRESIAHTQPRRIAARTIAERVAEELDTELGGLVGYQVRFTDRVSESTRIKVMTDGILLNEIHRDRDLRRYDTIIIDEAHERSLNIDFLLGYLTRLLPRRPDLRVIITSATIDPESFARHFADAAGTPAPIIEVSGRTYPVEVRYRPLVAESAGSEADEDDEGAAAEDRDIQRGILDALDELGREAPGDVLVFLSGESEIRDAEAAVRTHATRRGAADVTEVLPLYGRLSSADQHRVFEASKVPGLRRRVVLATNVAETSLTVPGIRYVIDAGTARISRYSARSKVQRLPIEPISQASANQRSGRSGRTSDGIAIRLYSEDDYGKRPEFTDPEILRTNLAAVILQMASLGLGAVEDFPFLTPPDRRGIRDGIELLRELGAIDDSDGTEGPQLTRIGRQLARLPIEPRFARMVLESKTQGVSREVLVIVAGLTIQDPRERPLERREQADAMHARFVDPTSDFLTLLNLWNHLEEQQRELSGNAFRRMCRGEFLNYLRVREWQDLYRQLVRLSKPLGLHVANAAGAPNPDGVHRSLLAGLLSQIGLRDDARTSSGRGGAGGQREAERRGRRPQAEFVGARNARFVVFPGSALAKKPPPALMAAELVETSRLFARTGAAIDPAWAEQLAGPLAKRTYSEPRWERRQGSAVADEKVTLFGVPIVAKRRIQLARVDAALARELFIRHALVEEDWDWSRLDQRVYAFVRRNRELRRELGELEERTRRRDVLAGDEAVVAFYEQRLPADATDARAFERWWRGAHRRSPELLTMTAADLVGDEDVSADRGFPDRWRQGDQTLTLRYRFEPGASDDGVSVLVPLVLLPRLEPSGFDWQVPGLRDELVTAMLRTLPKVLRRQVVPAAEWAAKIGAELPDGPESGEARPPFAEAVAGVIKRLTYAPVSADDFELDRLPPHLRVTFRAVDERGRAVGDDKDLAALQRRLAERAGRAVASTFAGDGGGRPGRRGGRSDGADRAGREGAPGPTHDTTPSRGDARSAAPAFAEQAGLTTWPWDELPAHVDTRQAGNVVRAYPAIVDEGASVALRLVATAEERDRASRRGIRRLLVLATPSPVAYVQEHLSNQEKLALATSAYAGPRALLEDCLAAVVDAELRSRHPDGLVRSRAEFESVRDAVSASVMDRMFETVALVSRILVAAREADRAIAKASSLQLMAALADARAQLEALVPSGFVSATGLEQLRHLPRYLEAIVVRVRRMQDNPGRDRQLTTEFDQARAAYEKAGGTVPIDPEAEPRLVRVRWLLEELRVGLFAQELRTAETVSVKRIVKALAD
ncbi:ATP-dependent helicase HrpA [Agromyces flavus]|uniref:ATP-dependent helicase HrpA n=2 Tax=Actinomycetes TaxID=1760 RepID=A0A1H1MKH1_9MICO|nr:ATP-dependent RNA helicase HrpA [Agromyces flavus]MCP2368802.1 ATP-dependent helicase HrpA [Agromyces flavus]GGI47960.1 ATP-dependent helicase [Agromyces flavus]SDR87341.1 ATP-dependent helicase HrpA [Agromyces flavus]